MSIVIPDRPRLEIFPERPLMGAAAARLVHAEIKRVVEEKGAARVVMACAPSQDDYYAALIPLVRQESEIWARVTVFHMDEYVGLSAEHPQSFRSYLHRHFLDFVTVARFHPIAGEAVNVEEEARNYARLLGEAPVDLISMGIGENGHIAFNDPPVADFTDPLRVKRVELDGVCRQQQVNDGCFASIDDVPVNALSLTLPVFSQAAMLVCIVPTWRKAMAVRNTLLGPIGTACPATLLRLHPRSHLLIDREAASRLDG